MSLPLNSMCPAVGSTSLMSVRESVVLPQPDSPTSPSVSPAWIVRSTPSTAWICPTVRLRMPARIGKYLTSPSTLRISLIGAARDRLCELRMTADQLFREVTGRDVVLAAVRLPQRGHFLAATEPPLREEAARMKRATGRPVDQRRRLSENRVQPFLVLGQLRQRIHEPD